MLPKDTNQSQPPPELVNWISTNEPSETNGLVAVWQLLELVPSRTPTPSDARLDAIRESALRLRGPRSFAIQWLSSNYRYAVGLAATIAVLLAALWMLQGPNEQIFETTEQPGKIVTLADGSMITLNSESSIRVSPDFGTGNRLVRLSGEALFDVQTGTIPFEVMTFNASIQVLGTRFNVRARESDVVPETAVYLEEGSVMFQSASSNSEGVTLVPGQFATISLGQNAPIVSGASLKSTAGSWSTGRIEFENMVIGDIASELSRRYRTNITVSDTVRERRFSLYLGFRENVESVLDDLCASANLRYSKTPNGYAVFD